MAQQAAKATKVTVKDIVAKRDVGSTNLLDQLLEVRAGLKDSVTITTRAGEKVVLSAVPLVLAGDVLIEAPVKAPEKPAAENK